MTFTLISILNSSISIQPGAIVKVSECKVCQCINNAFVCDADSCKRPKAETTDTYVEDLGAPIPKFEELRQAITVSTVTPPSPCDAEK